MLFESEYYEGMPMGDLLRIGEISFYNHNYYIGPHKNLLFARSDDDNTTEWYLVTNRQFVFLGETLTSEGHILHRYEAPQS